MEQYIPKSALVAEIERQISAIDNCPKITNTQISVLEGDKVVLTKLLSFIDTLEMKEVDLEKELESWRHNHFHGRRDKEASGEYLERVSQLELAKHFFELGIKVQDLKHN